MEELGTRLTAYLDASALVPAYVPESMSERVIEFLSRNDDPLVVSTWTITECISAFTIKARVGAITPSDAVSLIATIRRDAGVQFIVEAVLDADIAKAADLIAPALPPLRASDALHLAIALRLGAPILTLDRHMLGATNLAGVEILDLPDV